VSSFGLTGTNAHVVLEEAPARPRGRREAAAAPALATLSARSIASLRRYRAAFAEFVASSEHDLAEITQLMNRGRDDHRYRLAWPVASRAELLDRLRAEEPDPLPVADPPRVVLLLSGDGVVDDERWRAWAAAYPRLASLAGDAEPRGAAVMVARQYALARLLEELGVAGARLVGSGAGNLAVRALRGELTPAEAVGRAGDAAVGGDLDRTRLAQAAAGMLREPTALVEVAPDGVLSRDLAAIAPTLRIASLASDPGPGGAAALLAWLYRLGVAIDWERHYAGAPPARLEAPTYPFEEIRCWCRPAGDVFREGTAPPATATVPAPAPAAPGEVSTERALAAIWRDVLKDPEVETDSNYFQLGGTSIAAQTLIARVRRDLGAGITFTDVFSYPTLRELASRVDALRAAPATRADDEIVPAPRDRPLPLSFGQRQLWFLDQLDPGASLYLIQTDLHLRGALDVPALRGAIRDLGERHEILRTSIRGEDGEPRLVADAAPPELELVDLAWLPAADRDREARRHVDEDAREPFRLDRGPLLRARLLRLAGDEHVLLLTYHHIVFDGWTPSIVNAELAELYRARRAGRPADLAPLPIQYADFAAWQRERLRGERLEAGLRFWRDYLRGFEPFELPLDRPRPPRQSHRGETFEFLLDPEVAEGVRRLGDRAGVSTFATMFALVGAAISSWAGVEDVVLGIATSGRVHPSTHGLIGYFNNVVPFRLAVRPALSPRELIARSAERVAAVLDHEEIPFEKIVADWPARTGPERHPIFTVAYTHQNAPTAPLDLGGEVGVSRYLNAVIAGVPPGTAKFDLTLATVDQNRGPMATLFEWATDLFERRTMERLAGRYRELLRRAVEEPDRPLAELAPFEAAAR
jgi:hypothetical protein